MSDNRVPAWVDKATLCRETCLGEMTIDRHVDAGVLPPPVKLRGKLLWEWAEVHDWIKNGNPANREISQEERIRRGTLQAMKERRRA